jgi:hypothetical protein
MPRNRVPALLGLVAAASLGASTGCVVRAGGSATVRTHAVVEAEPVEAEVVVTQYPPEPQYEEVTVSPGADFVWTPGYWHWRGGQWVWMRGNWERQRVGYIYVNPYYDNVGGRFVYRPAAGWCAIACRAATSSAATTPSGNRARQPARRASSA